MEGREVIEPDPPHVIQIVHTRLFECANCRSANLREGPRGVHDLAFTARTGRPPDGRWAGLDVYSDFFDSGLDTVSAALVGRIRTAAPASGGRKPLLE